MTYMREPLIRAFSSQIISAATMLKDSEEYGKKFGDVRVGSTYDDFGIWWYNLGGARLTDAIPSALITLSTSVSETADEGAAADTTNAWQLGQSAAHLLIAGSSATAGSTGGWPVPMPSPFPAMSSAGPWQCGLRWPVPLAAALGKIRKSFRISGYYDTGWDYLWSCNPYMLMLPSDKFWAYPMTQMGNSTPTVAVDGTSPTGARMVLRRTTSEETSIRHNATGTPWCDTVSNVTGWRAMFVCRTSSLGTKSSRVSFVDGSHRFALVISPTGLSISSTQVSGGWTYVVAMTTWRTIELSVLGSNLLIYVDSVLRGNKTLTYGLGERAFAIVNGDIGTEVQYATIAYGLLSRNTPAGV